MHKIQKYCNSSRFFLNWVFVDNSCRKSKYCNTRGSFVNLSFLILLAKNEEKKYDVSFSFLSNLTPWILNPPGRKTHSTKSDVKINPTSKGLTSIQISCEDLQKTNAIATNRLVGKWAIKSACNVRWVSKWVMKSASNVLKMGKRIMKSARDVRQTGKGS